MNALLLALLVALVPAQDKITFQSSPKKGDKISKTETNEMHLKMKITSGEQTQEVEFGQRGSQQSTTEILDVVDGAVVKSLFKCTEHAEEKKGPPTMQWEKKEKPLQGRTITTSLVDGKLVREGADGLADKVLRKVELADKSALLFPKGPVAVGDSWDVAPADALKFFSADDDLREVKIKVKLLEVKEIDGRRCAVTRNLIEMSGKTGNGVDTTIKLDAESVVWLERGYTLSVKGKGTVTMKAENAQVKMDGAGPVQMEVAVKVE